LIHGQGETLRCVAANSVVRGESDGISAACARDRSSAEYAGPGVEGHACGERASLRKYGQRKTGDRHSKGSGRSFCKGGIVGASDRRSLIYDEREALGGVRTNPVVRRNGNRIRAAGPGRGQSGEGGGTVAVVRQSHTVRKRSCFCDGGSGRPGGGHRE